MLDASCEDEVFIGGATGKLRRRPSAASRARLDAYKQYGAAASSIFSPFYQHHHLRLPPFLAGTYPGFHVNNARLPGLSLPYPPEPPIIPPPIPMTTVPQAFTPRVVMHPAFNACIPYTTNNIH